MKTEEMIAVMQAYARGERIQSRAIASTEWWEAPNPEWNWGTVEYRIKPREPMEGYICVEIGLKNLHASLQRAQSFADMHPGRYRVVKVREVIEPEWTLR